MITPTLVQALQGKKVKSAVGGEGHSGALLVDGRLYTWGANDMGVLGHGRGSTQQWLPRMVRGDLAQEEVAQASLGMSHSGCVTEQGRLYTWGGGWFGRLGHGTTDNRYVERRRVERECSVL